MSTPQDSQSFAGGTPHRASHEGGRRFIDADGACTSSSVLSSATARLPVSSINSSLPRQITASLTRGRVLGNESVIDESNNPTNRFPGNPSNGAVILNMLASQSRSKVSTTTNNNNSSSSSLVSSRYGPRNGTQSASSSPIPFASSMTSPNASTNRGPLASLKVVVIGDYAVGKTSLIRQLTQRRFSHTTGTTIGVEFKEHAMPNAILQLWDVAGQQYSSSMTKQYYRGSAGAIVCADVTKETSFLAALDWRKDLMEKVGTEEVECLVPIDESDERDGGADIMKNSRRDEDSAAAGRGSDVFEERQSGRVNSYEKVDQLAEGPTISNRNPGENESRTAEEDRQVQPGSESPRQSSARYSVKKITRCAIPVFLFVNKGDLLSQSPYDVDKIKAFAEENHFDTAVITSAKDHASVRDAFQYVTNVLLEHHEANLTSTFLIQPNASTTSYGSPLGQSNTSDSVNRRGHVNRVVRLGRYQSDPAVGAGNGSGLGGNQSKLPPRVRGENGMDGDRNNNRGKCC